MSKHIIWTFLVVGMVAIMAGCPSLSSEYVVNGVTEQPQEVYNPYTPEAVAVVEDELEEVVAVVEEPLDPEQAAWAALEQEVFELINEERVAAGLSELYFDRAVQVVAREHSADMADNDYFAHVNLKGATPRDRLTDAGIPWRAYGENLAYVAGYADTAAAAVEGWMESTGHRANIMRDVFTHTGIGVVCDANGAYYLTQEFVTY